MDDNQQDQDPQADQTGQIETKTEVTEAEVERQPLDVQRLLSDVFASAQNEPPPQVSPSQQLPDGDDDDPAIAGLKSDVTRLSTELERMSHISSAARLESSIIGAASNARSAALQVPEYSNPAFANQLDGLIENVISEAVRAGDSATLARLQTNPGDAVKVMSQYLRGSQPNLANIRTHTMPQETTSGSVDTTTGTGEDWDLLAPEIVSAEQRAEDKRFLDKWNIKITRQEAEAAKKEVDKLLADFK